MNTNAFAPKLTAEQKRRVLECITETTGKLDKEMRFSPDLRKDDVVAFYTAHIAKLNAMLDA